MRVGLGVGAEFVESLRVRPLTRLSAGAGLPEGVAPALLCGGEGPCSEGFTLLSSDDILQRGREEGRRYSADKTSADFTTFTSGDKIRRVKTGRLRAPPKNLRLGAKVQPISTDSHTHVGSKNYCSTYTPHNPSVITRHSTELHRNVKPHQKVSVRYGATIKLPLIISCNNEQVE